MNIERNQDESVLDYHKRIIYGKLVDKTLADVDYAELSELVYGQPYSSDVARRMMYGSRRTLDLIESEHIKGINDNDLLSELDIKRIELQKERQRFSDQRREYNKIISSDGRREHLYDKLIESADRLSETVGTLYPGCNHHELSLGNDEAVLVFSDWHYGMTASNIFNDYNIEICKQRVKHVVEVASQKLILHRCKKLHVVVLGDLIHGAIHVGVRVASEELVCRQIMQVSEILAQSICEMSGLVEETIVYSTYGNHARTIQNKSDSIHSDNMEELVPWWLTQRLKHIANITVCPIDDNEFITVNACGHDFCASHGDLDSVKTSPRLFFTLFHKKYDRDIEYILLGDKHHRESFEELGITSFLCGSLCGADDHANEKRLYSTPSQLLLIVNDKYGVDAEYRIKCE